MCPGLCLCHCLVPCDAVNALRSFARWPHRGAFELLSFRLRCLSRSTGHDGLVCASSAEVRLPLTTPDAGGSLALALQAPHADVGVVVYARAQATPTESFTFPSYQSYYSIVAALEVTHPHPIPLVSASNRCN